MEPQLNEIQMISCKFSICGSISFSSHCRTEINVIYPHKGESEGYNVKTREKDFPISNYPLEQTEFFYEQKQGMVNYYFPLYILPAVRVIRNNLFHKGRDKLGHEKNKEFDYTLFHHRNDTKVDSFYMTRTICLISYEF